MAELLIVDDEAPFRRALRRTLERSGHRVLEAGSVLEAREVLALRPIELVLCDVNMPGGSGLELARRRYVDELESKVVSRSTALREALEQLELTQATARDAERDAVDRLVAALTIRSEETGEHIRRVGRFAALLARLAGVRLWSEDEISLAAMLHDVGKIGIPDAILLKPGPLDLNERGIIQRHSQLGSRMLADGRSPVLILGAQVALSHHERWDGTGYPVGLAEDEIPIAGRIAAIADVFDALTSDRVYRPALPFADALAEMRAQSGRHFDPDLLGLFLGATDQLEAIRAAHPDPSDA